MLERGEIHLGQMSASCGSAGRPALREPSAGTGRIARRVPSIADAWQAAGTIEVARLAPYPLLLLDNGFGLRRAFDAACRLAGLKPNILLESRSPHTLLALAEAGHGVAIIPSHAPNSSLRVANCPRDVPGQTAARAAGHLLGQAASAAALRHGLLRDAGRARARGLPDHAADRTQTDATVKRATARRAREYSTA